MAMFQADLDDEHRAHLAHEHPTDLHSSPSSSSSSVPTFYEARRRSKSASHHRSHTTADGSTTSSHLLARLVSSEEEVREINAVLAVTSERLEAESSRANAAERRALDYFHRLRIATENRERAEQESARLREELKLYKLQLENAQKEIFRAQDIIDQVSAQRNEAEADAARARTKARKLQEEKLVMFAREEGRRAGYREGLSMGRRVGYDQENYDGDDNDEDLSDNERNDPRSHIQLRSSASIRHQPMRPGSAPPVRRFETRSPLPIPSPRAVPVHTPSHEHRTPSPLREPDEPETIRPIPIHASPATPTTHITAPPDGWIPRADSRTSYIPVPPPHGSQPPIPPSPSFVAADFQDRRSTPQPEPTPIPPPIRARDYAYQPSVPVPVQRLHTPSLASRTSTHLSQYDLVNKRPGSSLRNEIYVDRAGSGSQPSRSSLSRNEHREQDHHHLDQTEAESIAEQWRADSETSTPPRNPPRSATPSSRRPVHFYYRPREIVTPSPLGDVDEDPRSRTPVPTEPSAPPDDPTARTRSPIEHLRQRFRQRPPSGGSGSTIPNIIVESPSEPETTLSPSAATAAQPELLSPEAANRPLPAQEEPSQHQHAYYSHQPSQSHHHHHQQQQPASSSSSAYERSGESTVPWPAGFVPYASTPTPDPRSRRSSERDTERHPSRSQPTPVPDASRTPYEHARTSSYPTHPSYPQSSGRTRTQSASMGMGRTGGYDAAPLPPGVLYPVPPARPHTSHRDRERDRDRDRDKGWDRGEGERERPRDVGREWEWERERDKDRDKNRDRDRDRDRRESLRNYEREREGGLVAKDTGRETMTQSPAALGRPISLFDSDDDR